VISGTSKPDFVLAVESYGCKVQKLHSFLQHRLCLGVYSKVIWATCQEKRSDRNNVSFGVSMSETGR